MCLTVIQILCLHIYVCVCLIIVIINNLGKLITKKRNIVMNNYEYALQSHLQKSHCMLSDHGCITRSLLKGLLSMYTFSYSHWTNEVLWPSFWVFPPNESLVLNITVLKSFLPFHLEEGTLLKLMIFAKSTFGFVMVESAVNKPTMSPSTIVASLSLLLLMLIGGRVLTHVGS